VTRPRGSSMRTWSQMLDRSRKSVRPEEVVGMGDLLEDLTKHRSARGAEDELGDRTGHEKHDTEGRNGGKSPNGRTPKRVNTETTEMEIEARKDRDGSFAPRRVPKGQRRLRDLDKKVITHSACDTTTRVTRVQQQKPCNVAILRSLISPVEDSVAPHSRAPTQAEGCQRKPTSLDLSSTPRQAPTTFASRDPWGADCGCGTATDRERRLCPR